MELNQTDFIIGKTQHSRKRKKQYYKHIRHQMEFYFSDANLSKDRFLNKLLAVNAFVPLETFLNFNKIKDLTNGIEEIQKALETSEFLQLSNDKQSVRRVTEFQKREDTDEYTVYVEALPSNATHETVRHQFEQFGAVTYVSIPKYRASGKIKEFAFVEFEDKSSVEKCLNAFQQFDGIIGDSHDPENLKSVTSYIKEQEDLESHSIANLNKTEIETNFEHRLEENANDIQLSNSALKRANEESAINFFEDVSAPLPKRAKIDNIINENEHNDNPDEMSLIDQEQKRKRRRRRKRNLSNSDTNIEYDTGISGNSHNAEDVTNTDDPNHILTRLRVSTKVEWKRLRNLYLTQQRQKFTEVKKLLHQRKAGENRKVSTLSLSSIRPVTMKNKKCTSPPPSKKICSRNINFYGAIRDEQNTNTYECSIIDENRTNSDKTQKTGTERENVKIEFEPGLIVKVNFDSPCSDVADFKAEMKQYSFVRYVDVKDGQTYAFIRVDSSRSAPVLIKHCAPNRCQILTGETETEYWAKIVEDREQKLSKAIKLPKSRNRKIRKVMKNIVEVNLEKIENKTIVSHIRFDD